MKVVPREEVPAMTRIVVDGREHDLGRLMHWRKEPNLGAVLPRNLDVSLAWVRLDRDQVLDPHIHPVASLVVCCQGEVRSTGELEVGMSEGDIMIIPPGELHGFVGAGPDGFWGLSIQFESLALYEDLDSPLVTFIDEENPIDSRLDAVTLLLQKNANFIEELTRHRLFDAMAAGYFTDDSRRARFLNYLQIWSDLYQRMLFCRAAFTDNSKFASVARLHLTDEFDHDQALRARPDFKPVWDPVIDAASHWFVTKMLSADDAEKTVLVHLVLEGAAAVFYSRFTRAERGGGDADGHFDAHGDGEVDTTHIKLGVDALREVPLKDHGSLMEAQIRGWLMFTTLFDRLAELCLDEREPALPV